MLRWIAPGWLTLLMMAMGCGGGAGAPTADDAAVPTEAAAEGELPSPAAGDAALTAPTPAPASPATREEITSLCKLYRKALRSRWDDARTRQEVGALELTTSTAIGWQRDMTGGDVDVALAASRELVTAAAAADLTTECEALVSLVTLSEAMQAAPGALRR